MNFLIAGATGGIGIRLSKLLHNNGHVVFTISRNPAKTRELIDFAKDNFSWEDNWSKILPEIDSIINLSGASIGKRWSKRYKEEIYSSRIGTTRKIVETLNKFDSKPIKFFSTSAIGLYPSCHDDFIDENSQPGTSFLSKVCQDWENEAGKINSFHNLVIGRFGVVLKEDDIALKRILTSYKLGFGTVIGNGNQWFSWIHIEDLLDLIIKSVTNDNFNGVYNFVSPNPVKFRVFIQAIGKILGKPFILSIPDYLVKIMFGEQSEVLISSQRVIPKRLIEMNYNFKYPFIDKALENIIG